MNALIPHAFDGEILTPRATVRVVGKSNLFRGTRLSLDLPAGLSISEILAEALAGDPGRREFAVHLDGHAIPRANWRRLRPKAGTTVTFLPRPQNSAAMRAVIGIVVAVAALAIAPWAVGLIGLTGIAASIGTAFIAGGVILAGTLALNALFPVPATAAAQTSTPLNSIQGAQNQANPFGPIPVVLGVNLQSPNYAAQPYTEIIGNDQFLRLLFCLGYGPMNISAVQIGATPLTSFTDYEIEIQRGIAGDPPITLYPGQVDEVDLQITLDDFGDVGGVVGPNGVWNGQFTSAGANAFSLDFTATNGISAVDGSGNAYNWSVRINTRYRRVGTGGWTAGPSVTFGTSYSPSRLGVYVAVAAGQYEVQVQKGTGNGGDPQRVQDIVVWTAIRSIKSAKPTTFPKPLAMMALRIKATDQLSGVISNLNCICTSLANSYSGAGGIWHANTATQNPADLFRLVLQGPANARPVADALIDIGNLQDWWTYCHAQGFKFNQVVNTTGAVYDKLCDIAAAGRAVPTFIDGRWGVIWDRPNDPIVQHFTPRNSWGFQGQKPYAQQPNGWRVQFTNEKNGYTQDERIVYDDGFSAANATMFEGIQFPGVTDPALIWRHGRFQIAQARLRPEKITISAGWENLICTRGDRVAVTHDVLLIGLASGRVKSVAGQVVTFDELVTVEGGKTYGMSFRLAAQASPIVLALDDTAAGDYMSLTLVGDLTGVAAEPGCLFAFGETAQEYAVYRVQGIAHQKDLICALTLVDDAPGIALADQGAIPAYNPNITIPPDPFTLTVQGLRYLEVIDGQGASVRSLVRLTWQVPRFGKITSFECQSRNDDIGASFTTVATIAVPLTSADIPYTSAGVWSFRVRCRFDDNTVSDWASLIGLQLDGLTFPPADVTNLHLAIIDGQTSLDWTIVTDQRILYYEVRKGSSWDTGLRVGDAVAQPPWATTGDGSYHVRAYVLSPFNVRIYSVDDAEITIAGSVVARNIIVSKDEQATGWTGSLDGGVIDGSFIRTDIAHVISLPWAAEILSQLDVTGLHIAVYVSSTIVDIGQPAECRFWTEFEADGILIGDDFLATPDVLASGDILATSPTRFIQAFPIWHFASDGENDVFTPADVFAPPDVFSEGSINWQDWVAVASGTRIARYYIPGYVLITNDAATNAVGTKFSWFVDVPDREDDYTELMVPNTGLDITFYSGGYDQTPAGGTSPLPFKGGPNGAVVPHVQSAIINATNGDAVKITDLTLTGCTVNVVNAGANVTRAGVNLLIRGY